jgi:beta-glucanase (GH16 family)
MNTISTQIRRFTVVAAAVSLFSCGGGSESNTKFDVVDPTEPVSDWVLVWGDDFDGAKIDANKWSHEVNCSGGGNQEKQCYTDSPDNSFVSDGTLKIVAKPAEEGSPLPYTSARLITQNKADFTYGRIEMRAKLPKGQGAWPAFWMMPTDSVYGGWPKSGEIDIMEAVNLGTNRADGSVETNVYGTIHYGAGPASDFSGQAYTSGASPADDFHTYAIEWQEGEIRWYMDNYLYATQRQSEVRTNGKGDVVGLKHRGWYAKLYDIVTGDLENVYSSAPFDQDFFLILNLAVGGQWPESVNEGGINPEAFAAGQSLEVDYVHVYECSVDPTTGKGCETVRGGYNVEGDGLVIGQAPIPSPPSNGIATPITIFDDVVNVNWVAWDCCGGSTPALVADDAERGNVYQFNVENGNDGTVFGFITRALFLPSDPTSPSRPTPFDASPMLTNGKISFDMKVLTPPTSTSSVWMFKVESAEGTTAVEIPITNGGPTPIVGEWVTYEFPLSALSDAGLDLVAIDVVMVFPSWGTGDGASFLLDNLRIYQDGDGGQTFPSFTVFDSNEGENPVFAPWDCCGGSTPAIVTDEDTNSEVVEFRVENGNSGTVLGFNNRTSDGGNGTPIDASAIQSNGVFSFDMKVINPPAGAAPAWILKIESNGDAAQFVEVNLTTSNEGVAPTTGQWQTYSFNLSALSNSTTLDVSGIDVVMIFPAWGTGADTVFRVDNVMIKVPGSDVPSGPAPISLLDESLAEGWALWDCCGGSTPVVVADGADHGNVAEFEVKNGNSGTVMGLITRSSDGGGDLPVDASAMLTNGVLRFDLKVVNPTLSAATVWTFKTESNGNASEFFEAPLTASTEGVAPVTGEWQTYSFPLQALYDAGLDVSAIDVIMVFPSWGTGDGAIYRLDNVEFAVPGSTTPTDPNPPTEPTTPQGPADTATLAPFFTDAVRTGWIYWDCCGGSTPALVAETGRGNVVQFTVVASGETVQGFSTRSGVGGSDAPLNVSAVEMTGTLSFDMKVVSAPDTAMDWIIKIESNGGVDAGGEAIEFNVSATNEGVVPTVGQWQTYTMDLADLANQGLDLSAIDVVLVFPAWGTGGGAVYQIDNIQVNKTALSPTDPVTPGETGPVTVFGDAVLTNWVVWDCCGGTTPVTPAVTDRGNVAEFTTTASGETVQGFNTRTADGGGNAPINVSSATTFSFDMLVVANPANATNWMLKIETTNDTTKYAEVNVMTSNEGVAPVVGTWQTYTFTMSDLTSLPTGLDSSNVGVIMMFPAWGTGGGAVYQIDNVVFDSGTITTPTPVDPPAANPPITGTLSVFDDAVLTDWVLWDCCGGTVPTTPAVTARGNVAEFTTTASGETVQGFNTRTVDGGGNKPINASTATSFSFDLLVVANPSNATEWLLKIETTDDATKNVQVDLTTSNEGVAPVVGTWQTFTFDMADFASSSLDSSNIGVIMVFPAWGTGGNAVYQIDNVVFTAP